MKQALKHAALGLAAAVPGVLPLWQRALYQLRSPGTLSARYCYSVWLRHLVVAHESGLDTRPGVVAELGPGNSLGVGAAALISGSDRYIGFDVVEYASDHRNLSVFDELVQLFRANADIPGEDEFPEVKPYLQDYRFPAHILTDDRLAAALDTDRLAYLRRSLATLGQKTTPDAPFGYAVPWYQEGVLKEGSVDMIVSQAVLEHVDALPSTYSACRRILKPGGFMSHQVDYRAHGTASKWNGHWAYSDLVWRFVCGSLPYVLNRKPHSAHIELLRENGFDILQERKVRNLSGIKRSQLASRFVNMSDDDFTCQGCLIQAARPA